MASNSRWNIKTQIFAVMIGLSSSALALNAAAAPEACLDWDVQTFPSSSEQSSCAYFNHDKVSTRFVVRNSCSTKVTGVFTYYKDDLQKKPVMNVQSFAVNPGESEEIANPCDMKISNAYQVSQVTF
ncbi:MAG: hypothetical protein ACI9BO_002505 [Zhongshania sp.]|jgi:hypothetical protein